MKSFIITIPCTQDNIGKVLAQLSSEDDNLEFKIATVEDVPYHKNGKTKPVSERKPSVAKPAVHRGRGRSGVTDMASTLLPQMPNTFRAIDLNVKLGPDAAKNIYSIMAALIKRGLLRRLEGGLYAKV